HVVLALKREASPIEVRAPRERAGEAVERLLALDLERVHAVEARAAHRLAHRAEERRRAVRGTRHGRPRPRGARGHDEEPYEEASHAPNVRGGLRSRLERSKRGAKAGGRHAGDSMKDACEVRLIGEARG